MLQALGVGNSTQCEGPSPAAAMSEGERGGKVMGRCTASHGCIRERERKHIGYLWRACISAGVHPSLTHHHIGPNKGCIVQHKQKLKTCYQLVLQPLLHRQRIYFPIFISFLLSFSSSVLKNPPRRLLL